MRVPVGKAADCKFAFAGFDSSTHLSGGTMRKLCYTVENSKETRSMMDEAKKHRVKFGKRGAYKEFPGGIVWATYPEAEKYKNSCNNKEELEVVIVKADFVRDTQPLRVGQEEYRGARHLTRWCEIVLIDELD